MLILAGNVLAIFWPLARLDITLGQVTGKKETVCVQNVQGSQLVDVVKFYLRGHPEERHFPAKKMKIADLIAVHAGCHDGCGRSVYVAVGLHQLAVQAGAALRKLARHAWDKAARHRTHSAAKHQTDKPADDSANRHALVRAALHLRTGVAAGL